MIGARHHALDDELEEDLHDTLTGIRLPSDPDLILCAVSLSFVCLAVATRPLQHVFGLVVPED